MKKKYFILNKMSTCSDNSNDPGCRDGKLYCNDPRCFPNCPGCDTNTSSGNWIIITIILVLLGVLLVMAFIIGFDWFNKTKKAAEPKNLTVNKHIHNIQQPSVVVTPPPPTIIETVPEISTTSLPEIVSQPAVSVGSSIPSLTPSSIGPISTQGIALSMDGCE